MLRVFKEDDRGENSGNRNAVGKKNMTSKSYTRCTREEIVVVKKLFWVEGKRYCRGICNIKIIIIIIIIIIIM